MSDTYWGKPGLYNPRANTPIDKSVPPGTDMLAHELSNKFGSKGAMWYSGSLPEERIDPALLKEMKGYVERYNKWKGQREQQTAKKKPAFPVFEWLGIK